MSSLNIDRTCPVCGSSRIDVDFSGDFEYCHSCELHFYDEESSLEDLECISQHIDSLM